VIALIFFEVAFPAAPTDSIEKRWLTIQRPLGKPYSRKDGSSEGVIRKARKGREVLISLN
jgi:hypothetical protein